MKFENGWIKIHRKMFSSDIVMDGHKPNADRTLFWLYLLCNVNIYESKIKHGFKDVIIPPGGMAFSYAYLSEHSGLTVGKVRRIIDYLQKTERVTVSTTSKGSYLIVKKWDQYQLLDASNTEEATKQTTNERQTDDKQTTNQRQQTEEGKKVRRKNKSRTSKTVSVPLVNLEFLSSELTDFISGVSDIVRMRWLSRYCKGTISDKLQAAKDWSEAKGRPPKNVALLMNTFFKETPHDKWKDEEGGCDPEEKALAESLNGLLEEGKREMKGNA